VIKKNESKFPNQQSLSLDIHSNPDENDKTYITLAEFAERAYLDYAISVVKGRAIPDICDGLKPVQRRILFAMDRMLLRSNSKPVKSARVVGDVLGKFHPHGDQSAYEALVRLAQDFSVRYPLIEGHGNFGSRDGDGAAAMRYTEARLTAFSELLLSEVDEGTVDFGLNYDGSFSEPSRLPARLPICLLNGASGIAVGMATEIPSHNLREVSEAILQILKNPDFSDDHLYKIIPGPDFPGGGQVISSIDQIKEVYSSGKGTLRTQARWKFEDLARGQWQMVVNELPQGISSKKILEEIDDLTNPKFKIGKKTLSSDQNQLKQLVLSMLDSVRDESGKDADVRLVFEPKTSRVKRLDFSNFLLAHTSLQSSFSINIVAINQIGKPGQFSLGDLLHQWVEFRISSTKRRSKFRLDRVSERIHILEGRFRALKSIEMVISIIRESDDPKQVLIEKLELSEMQANDILEIKLKQLAKLEFVKIETELKEKNKIAKKLKKILRSQKFLKEVISSEIEEDSKKFGDDRRTLIKQGEKAQIVSQVVDEPVTVIISENGWVRVRQGHGHDPLSFNFKTGDYLYGTYECRSTDYVVAISTSGRSFTVPIIVLPKGRTDGISLTSLIDIEPRTNLITFSAGNLSSQLLIITKKGLGFLTNLKGLFSRNKSGKQFLNLDQEDSPFGIIKTNERNDAIAILSNRQRLLIFGQREIKKLPNGGRGVLLMSLESKDYIASVQVVGSKGLILTGKNKKLALKEKRMLKEHLMIFIAKRGNKGKFLNNNFVVRELKDFK